MFKNGIEFNVALEDDAVLSPDALEFAEWFYALPNRSEYVYCSLGDPHYRTERALENEYRDVHECRSIYTSAWCFTKFEWAWMREWWNRHLRTQVGWDWSLAYAMETHNKRSLYPLVSRAKNIGRVGVHSYPEFFDEKIAPARGSDGRPLPFDMAVTYRMGSETLPNWITEELKATEDRYAYLRNK